MQRYIQLFRALYEANVEYLLCGGLAVNIYGVPRVTADIDLMLDFSTENLRKFKQVAKGLSYAACIPIDIETLTSMQVRKQIVEQKNMIAYSYYHEPATLMNLDVLVKTTLSFEYLWKRKAVRKFEDFEVFLISLPDLITMKKSTERKQDLQDVEILEKLTNIDKDKK